MNGRGDTAHARGEAGTAGAEDGTMVTIGEWIDQRPSPVPSELRPHLSASGPVSPDVLLVAAEREVTGCAAGSPRDRRAAFTLLAADAYVTYACELAMMEGADAVMLKRVARRVAHGWRDVL